MRMRSRAIIPTRSGSESPTIRASLGGVLAVQARILHVSDRLKINCYLTFVQVYAYRHTETIIAVQQKHL